MPPSSSDVAPWLERLARLGYAAKALLYLTVGYLASQAALGMGGRVTDTHGAMRLVNGGVFGRGLILAIALGLSGYALWRLVEAAFDPEHHGTGAKGLALRIGFAIRGLFHGALGITAFRLALGDHPSARGDQAQSWTAWAFDLPGGSLLVGLAATGIAAYGVYQFYRASTPRMRRHLRLSELPEEFRSWVLGVSRFGIAARGVVFCLVGIFLARAAWSHDAGLAGGLRESLRTLAGLGSWPFTAVAFGLVAYGVFELVNARYRTIKVE